MWSIQAPAHAVRSRGLGFSRLSGGRARPGSGPRGRSGGASSPEACAHSVRRAALRLPSGSRSGLQLPWAPSLPAPGARRPRLLSPAPAAACLCCFLSLDRPPVACSPPVRPRVGWGGRLLRGCTHLQRPGSSLGMHRPPQVAKRGGENAPAPPPPARSPGCGGRGSRRAAAAAAAGGGGSGAAPGASAPRNNLSGWRWADVRTARRMVH